MAIKRITKNNNNYPPLTAILINGHQVSDPPTLARLCAEQFFPRESVPTEEQQKIIQSTEDYINGEEEGFPVSDH